MKNYPVFIGPLMKINDFLYFVYRVKNVYRLFFLFRDVSSQSMIKPHTDALKMTLWVHKTRPYRLKHFNLDKIYNSILDKM